MCPKKEPPVSFWMRCLVMPTWRGTCSIQAMIEQDSRKTIAFVPQPDFSLSSQERHIFYDFLLLGQSPELACCTMAFVISEYGADKRQLTNGYHGRIQSDQSSSPNWGYDTIQVHAGLEEDPVYGQCTLPVYDSVAFKYKSSQAIAEAFGSKGLSDAFVYSRFGNVSRVPRTSDIGIPTLIRHQSPPLQHLRGE